jgi:signal transduction histidine kinase
MIEPVEQQMVVPRWQRLLLPSAMLEEPRGRRSVRDWIVDLTMFALALGIGALVLHDTWSDHSHFQAVLDIVLGVTAAMSLWWRRSHPAAVGAFAGTLSLVSALANGAGVMAFFNAALRTSGRTLAALIGLALVNTIVFPLIYPGADAYVAQLLVGLLITGVVVGWGLFVRVQRELVRSLRERAERLQAEQRLKVDQAREAERLRIAREMHDVLAHRVSLLSLHAGALEFRPDASPEEIAEAAGVIRATAHAALEDLRGVVGVLRDGAEDGAPEPPQPTLDQIPSLIEESRAAGMRVRAQIEPPPDALPAAVGRTAYRVVQEGLTNARKHAPGAAVDVAVSAREGDGLVVEVVSRRPVGVAVTTAGDRMPGAGTGLIGLAERVALAGGELRHGPDATGDFVLRATIPWAA